MHPDYYKASKKWKLVRSIVDNDAQKYLPIININDPIRSESYKEAGYLTNYTALTKEGLTGLVFRKPPIVSLPSQMDYLFEDVNGAGFTITQFSQKIIGELLQTGRVGILVDYPKIDYYPSALEEPEKSRLKMYTAESILDWRIRTVGSKTLLSLIKLEESVEDITENGLGYIRRTQYRVLELDAQGIYTQTVYDESERHIIEGPYQPTDYDGNVWYEIPFQFIGSENNDSFIDNAPLYDIAIVNLAHYRDSCDVQESSFYCSQPTTFVHANGGAFAEAYGDVELGSKKLYVTGEGSSVTMVQANPNNLARELMKDKEKQIASIGARIISEPGGGRETAEGARIRFASANSALYTLTTNTSLGIETQLKKACKYQGANPNQVLFKLNDQFYEETADPNLITAQMLLVDRGVIAKNDIRDYARKTNLLLGSRTNEQIDSEATVAKIATVQSIDNRLLQQEEGNNGNQ